MSNQERDRVPDAGGQPPKTRVAVYAGSFDPVTKGHEDVMHRSLEFVDRLVVAVAINSAKQPLFGVEHATTEPVPDGGSTRRYGSTAVTIYRANALSGAGMQPSDREIES